MKPIYLGQTSKGNFLNKGTDSSTNRAENIEESQGKLNQTLQGAGTVAHSCTEI